jgi:hypothetical protein
MTGAVRKDFIFSLYPGRAILSTTSIVVETKEKYNISFYYNRNLLPFPVTRLEHSLPRPPLKAAEPPRLDQLQDRLLDALLGPVVEGREALKAPQVSLVDLRFVPAAYDRDCFGEGVSISVPLYILSDDQKQSLRDGL